MKHLISISGKKQSGKSTVAQFIKELVQTKNYNTNVLICSWSWKMYEELSDATGLSITDLKNNKDILRPLLQAWGTDFRRNYTSKTYWIDKLIPRIKILAKDYDYTIVDDTRFVNELEMMVSLKAVCWKVIKNVDPNIPIDNHASETELDHIKVWHSVIENNEHIGLLKSRVRICLEQNKLI